METFIGLVIFGAFAYGVWYLVKRKKQNRATGTDGSPRPRPPSREQ